MSPHGRIRLPATPAPRRGLLVGFSGGLDSTVLLHLLRLQHDDLRAIHVHHGLHADADAWAAHCERECAALDVPLRVVRVTVERASGLGLEGAARAARHAAFAAALGEGELLVLAHHLDDQAETFLLRALRGSGTDGLAAMRSWRPFHRGQLWRPLLEFPRSALLAHASRHGLRWIEDPGNAEDRHDRNLLRNRVFPLLRERWPHAAAALAQSARHCAQASDLLREQDRRLLAQVRLDAPSALCCKRMHALAPEQQARVLRLWLRELGLPPLPETGIRRVLAEVVLGAPDRQPQYAWHGARLIRWRDQLHAQAASAATAGAWQLDWDGATPLPLPDGSQLRLEGMERFDAPVRVRPRTGGERIRLPGRAHSSSLKHLLQERQIPPWTRSRLPLLVAADGALLAAGDAIVSDRLQRRFEATSGRLVWRQR